MPSVLIVRRLAIALLLVSACGGTVEATTSTSAVVSSSSVPEATSPTSSAPAVTSTHPESTTTTSDRQPAADFTLELGEGGSYTLSEGAAPVFLVFWAEW